MNTTYGSVTHADGAWTITCEPFVRARLKRLFPRIKQEAATEIRLSASAENTRELSWFLERFPMSVDKPQLLERLAQQHRDGEQRLADLIAGHIPPLQVVLAEPPREYQSFAAQMLSLKGGLLLADDLGLGKTVSGICPMSVPANLPALVVAPAHLTRQWSKQIKRFTPSLSVHIINKGTPYDLSAVMRPKGRKKADPQLALIPESRIPDVLVVSYHMLRGWAETLAGLVKYVVYDECQQLRNPGSAIYTACKLVAGSADLRLGLSATPIYNYGNEFFSVVDVLQPDMLGEYGEFTREWCTPLGNGKHKVKDSKEFGAYLRREGIMLRRTRADVSRELPELTKVIHEIEADEKALEALNTDAVALARIMLKHNESFRGERMQASGEFDALMRQATGLAKAPYVAEFVRLLLESGEPVVLFGWHRAVYSIWLEKLAEFNPVLYTGSESANQKDETIRRFLAGESKLLIMSLRSGAGVDGLQGYCHTAVFGEFDWSAGVHAQCMGRIHRDGTNNPCVAYFLLSDHGSDPIMAEVLGMKREQSEGVLNPDAAMVERIDTGENTLRRLAREFLDKRGLGVPEDAVVTAEPEGQEVAA